MRELQGIIFFSMAEFEALATAKDILAKNGFSLEYLPGLDETDAWNLLQREYDLSIPQLFALKSVVRSKAAASHLAPAETLPAVAEIMQSQAADEAVFLATERMADEVPESCRGFIVKQGQIVKNWKNRYFVLDKGILRYFESPSMSHDIKKQKGEFPLKGCQVLTATKNRITLFSPRLRGKEQPVRDLLLDFHLCPDSLEVWKVAFEKHIRYLG